MTVEQIDRHFFIIIMKTIFIDNMSKKKVKFFSKKYLYYYDVML